MATSPETAPALVTIASPGVALPRNCTFSESDWFALAPAWYPVAFSHEVTAQPYATKLLDERLVLYRITDGTVVAARDLCLHRGVPLSLGHVDGNEIVCKYHGLRYAPDGRCTCIPAHPGGALSPRLRLQTYPIR